jgi:signal transduction histidine kinase
VSGLAEEGLVRIGVADTGIGIRAEDLPRLFQPFVQLDDRLARSYEGAGLGLALAKALVELHGGSVTVESVFSQGSCFTVTLPWQAP